MKGLSTNEVKAVTELQHLLLHRIMMTGEIDSSVGADPKKAAIPHHHHIIADDMGKTRKEAVQVQSTNPTAKGKKVVEAVVVILYLLHHQHKDNKKKVHQGVEGEDQRVMRLLPIIVVIEHQRPQQKKEEKVKDEGVKVEANHGGRQWYKPTTRMWISKRN